MASGGLRNEANSIIKGEGEESFPRVLDGKDSACKARDLASILELERCPGEGNCNPLQYSHLENSMDRGAWWAMVYGGHKEVDMTE